MVKYAAVLALACVLFAAAELQAGPYEAARTVQIAATIQAMSQRDRHVTLLRNDGTKLIVEAGPAVKNLNEVKPGDKVLVIYQEGLIAEVKPKGQDVPGAKPSSGTVPSDPRQRTTPAADGPIVTTVRIKAVDTSERTVTFTRADGETRKLTVVRPDAERFIQTLKAGDEVEVTYSEAVAVSIEPDKG
jgi:hypothetical protein